MGFILYVISVVLRIIIQTIGIIYGFFKCIYKKQIGSAFRNVNNKFMVMAKSIDIHANSVCYELFTDILITKDSIHHFGNAGETISEVVAANYSAETLTGTGE